MNRVDNGEWDNHLRNIALSIMLDGPTEEAIFAALKAVSELSYGLKG